jgi:L-asparagine transporter-like permease
MPVSTKVNTRKGIRIKYTASIGIIVIGVLFQLLKIGGNEFAGFPSLGLWIIFIGFIATAIVSLNAFSKKEKIIDERMEHIGYKASRITTLLLILMLFATMILDGIYTISIRYYLYASFLVCFYIFSYLLTYKIIERNN